VSFLEENLNEVEKRLIDYQKQNVYSLWNEIPFVIILSFLKIFKIFEDEGEKNHEY